MFYKICLGKNGIYKREKYPDIYTSVPSYLFLGPQQGFDIIGR